MLHAAPGGLRASDSVPALLARADADDLIGRENPDLPVANRVGPRRRHDGLDDLVHLIVIGDDLDASLGDEVHLILGPPIDLGVTALAAEPARVGDGHALHADAFERLLDLFELEGLDDGDNQFHYASPPLGTGTAAEAGSCA